MKKILLLLLLAVSSALVYGQGAFSVTGKVKGLADGTNVELYARTGHVETLINTVKIQAGRFYLRGTTVGNGIEAFLIKAQGVVPIDIWVYAGSKIKIIGKDGLWKATSKVKEQKEQNIYDSGVAEYAQKQQILYGEQNRLINKLRKAEKDEDLVDLQDMISAVDKKIKNLQISADLQRLERLGRAPVDTIWMEELAKVAHTCHIIRNYPYRKDAYMLFRTRLDSVQQHTALGIQIAGYITPKELLKAGDMMKDEDLFDMEGKLHHLTEFLGNDMLLCFWSSNSESCTAALGELTQLAEENKSISCICISLDVRGQWMKQPAIKNAVNLCDASSWDGTMSNYNRYNSIPCFVLISPDGKIVRVWNGYAEGDIHRQMQQIGLIK